MRIAVHARHGGHARASRPALAPAAAVACLCRQPRARHGRCWKAANDFESFHVWVVVRREWRSIEMNEAREQRRNPIKSAAASVRAAAPTLTPSQLRLQVQSVP
jgi:hypothetical protein